MSSAHDVFPISAQAVAVPVVSLLAMLICIPPLIWHCSNRNLPASCLIGYIIISDLINVINAVIWPTDNVEAWWNGVGLCDVEVKVISGYQVGLPGALLCIFRNLALVMDTDRTTLIPSHAQRLRKLAFEIVFCVAVPVLAMVMHFIVQGNRYFIFAISGCNTTFEQNWVSLVLWLLWPPLICLAAAAYGVLVLVRLVKYRSEFRQIIGASGSGLTAQRFIRLYLLSFIIILLVLPLQMYVMYMNVAIMLPLQPFSWHQVLGPDWDIILRVPTGGVLKPERWIPVAASILLFVFFGLGQDAVGMYRSGLRKIGVGRFFPCLSNPRGYRKKSTDWYGTLKSKFSDGTRSLLYLSGMSIESRNVGMSSVSSEPSPVISDGVVKEADECCCHCGRRSNGSVLEPPRFGHIAVTREIRLETDCNV